MNVIVLHSGGLDSTVLLYALTAKGHRVVSLGVDYGQRHLKELGFARQTAALVNAERLEVAIPPIVTEKPDIPDGHYAEESMKATVSPNRNMILLAYATGLAVDRKWDTVAYAAHAGDHTIYPDCRPEFIGSMRSAMRFGNWVPVDLHAPFVYITKRRIVEQGHVLKVPFNLTWSCYRAGEKHCGRCGTCVERREAFSLAEVSDPTQYN